MKQKPTLIQSGPIEVKLVFHMPRPKALKRDERLHIKKPDIDNIVKALFDAMTGVVWRDDSQVCHTDVWKIYFIGKEPGIVIEVNSGYVEFPDVSPIQ